MGENSPTFQRWEHELFYRELKRQLRKSAILQSHTVTTAAQEIAGANPRGQPAGQGAGPCGCRSRAGLAGELHQTAGIASSALASVDSGGRSVGGLAERQTDGTLL